MRPVKRRSSQGADFPENTRPAVMRWSVARLQETVNLACVHCALRLPARANRHVTQQLPDRSGLGLARCSVVTTTDAEADCFGFSLCYDMGHCGHLVFFDPP